MAISITWFETSGSSTVWPVREGSSSNLRTRVSDRRTKLHVYFRSLTIPKVRPLFFFAGYLAVCVLLEWRSPSEITRALPEFLTNKSTPSMTSIWQVHASIVILSIPLLTFLVEQSKTVTMLATSVAAVLFEQAKMRFLIWTSFGSVIVGGISTLIFDSESVVAVSVLFSAAIIYLIGKSYYVTLKLLRTPSKLIPLSIAVLKKNCVAMVDEQIKFKETDKELAALLNRESIKHTSFPNGPSEFWHRLPTSTAGWLVNVDTYRLVAKLRTITGAALGLGRNPALDDNIPLDLSESPVVWVSPLGTQLKPGASLIAIQRSEDDRRNYDKLTSPLAKFFTIKSEPTQKEILGPEISVLLTHTLAAIEPGSTLNFRDGLNVYERLLESYGQSPSISEIAIWKLLFPEFKRIARRVPLLEGSDERDDFIEFLGRLLRRSMTDELQFDEELLIIFQVMFQLNLVHDDDKPQSSFYLFEMVSYYFQYELLYDNLLTTKENHLWHVIDFFMTCLRISIRARNEKFTILCLRFCKQIAQNFKAPQASHSSNISTNTFNRANNHVWTYWFAIVSYIHMELQNEPTSRYLRNLYLEMSDLIPSTQFWTSYLNFRSDDVGNRPWTWWETEKWQEQGIRSGSLGRLDDSAHVAIAFLIINGTPGKIDNLITETRSPAQTEHLLKDIIAVLDDANKLRNSLSPDRPPPDLNLIKQKLVALQTEYVDQRRQDEINLHLIPEKIHAFHAKAQEVWGEPTILRSDSKVQAVTTKKDEYFGITNRVTRHYFTNNPGVFADPADLARHMTSAICEGEENLIIERIVETQPDPSFHRVKLEEIESKVAEAVALLHGRKFRPKIYIFDSWRSVKSLCPDANDSPMPNVIHVFRETEVQLGYRGDESLCIIADLQHSVRIDRWRLTSSNTDEKISADGYLKSEVRPVNRVAAEELVKKNPRLLLTSDGNGKTQSQAVSELMNTIVVSLQTMVEVKVANRSAVEFFWIEDDQNR